MEDHNEEEFVAAIADSIPAEFTELAAIQEENTDQLMALDNVVGVGLGNRVKKGVETDEQCITVFVKEKLDENDLDDDQVVRLNDAETDVVEVGEIYAGEAWVDEFVGDVDDVLVESDPFDTGVQTLRGRTRPVLGGYSVGHPRVTAGTIATACYDIERLPGIPPRYYVLSNNHVLANSNNARVGDPIIQPGRVDGGRVGPDNIGRLSKFIPIRFKNGKSTPCNYVDAAIAEVPFHLADRRIYWVGTVKGVYKAPRVGEIVQKTGRTTNFTTGRITSVNATVDVNFGSGRIARFCRQIVTTNMSAGGDSGSLVTNRDEQGVGLLFAGSSQATIMNHLHFVQLMLGVRVSES